ncbi:MAG: ribokinase [Chloroflexi bacterium]|nr:ribokinase [Chloroflexota bacterium]
MDDRATNLNSSVSPASLSSWIARLAGRRVLVIGDVFLDEYLIGRVQRLSREAPVPVLEQTRREYLPGGAANPAVNIQSLGGRAVMVGVVGADETAHLLRQELTARGVDIRGLLVDATRPTTRKTRIVAEGGYVFAHHLARVDHISRSALDAERAERLKRHIFELAPGCGAVLISDYRAGVVTPGALDAARAAARSAGALLIVDSQGDLSRFAGFDLVRCNRHEAARFLGRSLREDADFASALTDLAEMLDAGGVVISRGSEGLSFLARGREVQHLPSTNRSRVFDVTGAGDTQIAVITLALAAGLDLATAAYLGNAAAGVAVRHLGNVAVTPKDLLKALSSGTA